MATIIGTEGDDTIPYFHLTGNDEISLRGGNDTMPVRDGTYAVDGGDGFDTILFDLSRRSSVGGVPSITGDRTVTIGANTITDSANRFSFAFSSIEHIWINQPLVLSLGGSSLASGFQTVDASLFSGTGGVNFTFEYSGNLTLIGSAANDRFTVNTETSNSVDGGAGYDSLTIRDRAAPEDFIVTESGGSLFIANGTRTTTVRNMDTIELATNPDSLFPFVPVVHTNDHLILIGQTARSLIFRVGELVYGDAGDNALVGKSGHDILDGRGGADTMAGLLGDDSYVIDDIGDAVVEQAGEGRDTVFSTVNHTLAANVEALALTGTSGVDGTGNSLDNDIFGNGAANTLMGGQGNDMLDGGAGADILIGELGDDRYVVDNPGDNVIEQSGEGGDAVFSSLLNYMLPNAVEYLQLVGNQAINGFGNALDNVLIGNSATNILDGLGGDDTLSGDKGNDSYVVDSAGDVVIEALGGGDDVVFSHIDYTLGFQVERLQLLGTAVHGIGNDLNNIIIGTAGANILEGGEGNDILDGGAGADTLASGVGNDGYVVDDAGDVVTEIANQGFDTVFSSITYTLPIEVESLSLTGNTAIDGYGNSNANWLFGNTAANRLDGGAGDDKLEGGGGADALVGGAGNDIFVFRRGDANQDTILDFDGAGANLGDSIYLIGYGPATLVRVDGTSDVWAIKDSFSQTIDVVHIAASLDSSDIFIL